MYSVMLWNTGVGRESDLVITPLFCNAAETSQEILRVRTGCFLQDFPSVKIKTVRQCSVHFDMSRAPAAGHLETSRVVSGTTLDI